MDEPEDDGEPQAPSAAPSSLAADAAEAKAAIEAVLQAGEGEEIENLPPTSATLAVKDLEQDIDLKRAYARILLGLLATQLAIADAVFVVYAWAGVNWALSASVIEVWLGATLIEVVGIVLVVTRYLFPQRP